MAKVVLICGKLCCGKSTYAEKLRARIGAVLLSVDEIMLAVFGQDAGDKHDEYTESVQRYLFNKSAEIIETGISVILDWGFWTKEKRASARAFYCSRGIECEFHYIDISDETWHTRLERRNNAVLSGQTDAYYVDAGLAAKFESLFEAPEKDEIDVWLAC